MNYSIGTIWFLIRLARSLQGLIPDFLETIFVHIKVWGAQLLHCIVRFKNDHGEKSMMNSGWIGSSLLMAVGRIHTFDTGTTNMIEWWCYAVYPCDCINHTNTYQHLQDIPCIWLQCLNKTDSYWHYCYNYVLSSRKSEPPLEHNQTSPSCVLSGHYPITLCIIGHLQLILVS